MRRREFPIAGQPVQAEPLLTLTSPAFTVPRPQVRNVEVMGLGCRDLMERLWKANHFKEQPIEVFHLKNVFLLEECLILDDELRLIENASDRYKELELASSLARLRDSLEAGQVPFVRTPAIAAKRRAANNYGHFLLEMLPMAVIGLQVCQQPDVRCVIHRTEAPMMDVTLRSFRLLGLPLGRLIVQGMREAIRFDDLYIIRYIIRGLTQHTRHMSPRALDGVNAIAAAVPPGPDDRLFVRRIPSFRSGRALINEAAVCDRLAARGYRIVEPGAMSLEQQVAAFKGARTVIGLMGAAMTNIAFCEPGASAIFLTPSEFPDIFFWMLAHHRGLIYTELRGQQGPEGPSAHTGDFSITEDDIAWLETLDTPKLPTARITAHITTLGEVTAALGDTIGRPGSGLAVEAFHIGVPLGSPKLRYRAVLADGSLSPWAVGGALVGTSGLDLPICGFAIGIADDAYHHTCHASFTDGSRMDAAGENPCRSPSLAPLESFSVLLRRK